MRYSEKLNRDFFIFHHYFQLYGVKIIPIFPGQLSDLIKGSRPFVISVVKDIKSYFVFSSFRKSFLDHALLNNRLTLYEVTSFSSMIFVKRPGKELNYFSYKLPQSFDDLSSKILYLFLTSKRDSQKWPGGKRATLPQF